MQGSHESWRDIGQQWNFVHARARTPGNIEVVRHQLAQAARAKSLPRRMRTQLEMERIPQIQAAWTSRGDQDEIQFNVVSSEKSWQFRKSLRHVVNGIFGSDAPFVSIIFHENHQEKDLWFWRAPHART